MLEMNMNEKNDYENELERTGGDISFNPPPLYTRQSVIHLLMFYFLWEIKDIRSFTVLYGQ